MHYYRLGLIGWPVVHSLSPQIHGIALRDCGLKGEYNLYPLDPQRFDEQIPGFLQRMRNRELDGINVTVPHKQRVLAFLDRLTEAAQAARAVNTIYLEGGELVGDNTDINGFWMDLERLGWVEQKGFSAHSHNAPSERRAIVLGAGGAARAAALALGLHGWQVGLAARRKAQAVQAAAELNLAIAQPQVTPVLLGEDLLKVFDEQITMIINATSAGMHPQIEADAWPAQLPIPDDAKVYDLVYNPPQTPLLRRARLSGAQTANGLGMLVGQAVLAFQRWIGQMPAFESILQEISRQLTGS